MVQVSCASPTGYGSGGGGVTASYSGLTLATGGDARIDPNDRKLDPQAKRSEDRIALQPLVTLSLVLVLAGFVISIAASRRKWLWIALSAGLAAAAGVAGALIAARTLRDAMVAKLTLVHPAQLASVGADNLVAIGQALWLVTALLLITAAFNLWLLVRSESEAPT